MESSHFWPFLEFSSYELWSGGPDPHLSLAVKGMQEANDELNAAWRAGCYMSPYVISTGAAIWEHWNLLDVIKNPEKFTAWVIETWPHWQIRRERRAARTPSKMSASMLTYANWVYANTKQFKVGDYENIWESANNDLLFYGRYAIIKILEALYRAGLMTVPMPDIRPKDAWSPRRTLAWIFPDEAEILEFGKGNYSIDLVNRATENLRQALSQYVGYEVSTFQVEVLLCNYRQVLDVRNGRYPGWSQDADLMYHKKILAGFNSLEFNFFAYRKELFPPEILGELQGWDEPRKELCGYKGYFWCDKIYDYHSTKDLTNPVKRSLI